MTRHEWRDAPESEDEDPVAAILAELAPVCAPRQRVKSSPKHVPA